MAFASVTQAGTAPFVVIAVAAVQPAERTEIEARLAESAVACILDFIRAAME